MGNLNHNAGTVAGLRVGTFGTTVNHVLQNLETLFDQTVTFDAFYID
jgi:hypothetical protein